VYVQLLKIYVLNHCFSLLINREAYTMHKIKLNSCKYNSIFTSNSLPCTIWSIQTGQAIPTEVYPTPLLTHILGTCCTCLKLMDISFQNIIIHYFHKFNIQLNFMYKVHPLNKRILLKFQFQVHNPPLIPETLTVLLVKLTPTFLKFTFSPLPS